MVARLQDFEEQRPYLMRLAYRMLGSVADAQDIVQDAYLRWHAAQTGDVENARAFLSTIVTRLCLDQLKSARHRRETYIGPWLPEPLIEDIGQPDQDAEEIADDVSVALMLALERLSPLERAAFILHDVFDMDFGEIAGTLDRTEAACRQLAARARAHMRDRRVRYSVSPAEGEQVVVAFLAASRSGDVSVLREILAAEVVLTTDGGGRKIAALRPICGLSKVVRFFAGIARKAGGQEPKWIEPLLINGMRGFASIEWDGTLQTTALDIKANRITAIYITRNPDKLRHLSARVPPTL